MCWEIKKLNKALVVLLLISKQFQNLSKALQCNPPPNKNSYRRFWNRQREFWRCWFASRRLWVASRRWSRRFRSRTSAQTDVWRERILNDSRNGIIESVEALVANRSDVANHLGNSGFESIEIITDSNLLSKFRTVVRIWMNDFFLKKISSTLNGDVHRLTFKSFQLISEVNQGFSF